MDEKSGRINISLPTENLVAVNGEVIKKVPLFRGRLLDERRKSRFERLQLSRMNFEVRMQTDEMRERFHASTLHRPVKSSSNRKALLPSAFCSRGPVGRVAASAAVKLPLGRTNRFSIQSLPQSS